MAPYVYLTNKEYEGIFSDNGFLVMPQKNYDITFTPLKSMKVDIDKFQQALSVRYAIILELKDLITSYFFLLCRTIRDTYTDRHYDD